MGQDRARQTSAPALAGRWVALMFGVAAATALILPSGASGRPGQVHDPGQVRDVGATLYLQNCATCHGVDGSGTSAGPSLVGVGAASADFYLRTGRMPLGAPDQRPIRQEPIFDRAEIDAIVGYVAGLGPGPSVPQVSAGGDVRRGWQLYQANCAACHAASGSGNAVGGGAVAVGLGEADPVEIAEAMLIGPGVMPRFDFPPEDRDAVIAYIEFLRAAPDPGGAPIGGFGPVSEGFVSIAIGLLLVLLTVRFVGRRSHEGEPGPPLGGWPRPHPPPTAEGTPHADAGRATAREP